MVQKVTPWEVEGEIDYKKLIKEFGVQPLDNLPKEFEKELIFRRNIVFAHRDIQRVLEAKKNKKPFAMMTGLMPTGRFHIGHALIAQQIIFWQNLGAKVYIAVADVEAYLSRNQSFEDSKRIAFNEYIKNYIALGLKKKNLEIYFQSDRSKDAKKSNAYYRLQNELSRYATFNEFKGAYGEITPGKMLASLLQATDMLHPQLPEFENSSLPTVIPVGIDQDPHLRLTRDISKRIKDHKFTQLSSTYNVFMPSLSGGKMSSSDPNSFIALTDSEKEVENKIKRYAFSGGQETLDLHRKKGGNTDIDVSFQYLKMMFEEDDKKLAKIEADYKSGKMTTGELKDYTINKINTFLKKHQAERKKAEKQLDSFLS